MDSVKKIMSFQSLYFSVTIDSFVHKLSNLKTENFAGFDPGLLLRHGILLCMLSLEPSCNITFMHAFSIYMYVGIWVVLTLVDQTKIGKSIEILSLI